MQALPCIFSVQRTLNHSENLFLVMVSRAIWLASITDPIMASSLYSSSSSPPSPPSSTISASPITLHSFVSIKLNNDNYWLWKAQIRPNQCGQHLFGYVDGNLPISPQLLSASSSDGSTPSPDNPAYTKWYCQDQVILSMLVSIWVCSCQNCWTHYFSCSTVFTRKDVLLHLSGLHHLHPLSTIYT